VYRWTHIFEKVTIFTSRSRGDFYRIEDCGNLIEIDNYSEMAKLEI